MSRVIIFFSIVSFSIYQTEQAYFLSDEYIDQINDEAITWKAGRNFPSDTPAEYFTSILGSKNNGSYKDLPVKLIDPHFKIITPKNFDARKMWNYCQTIGHVRDQGHCDSSWAMSTTSALSDRVCIATDGKFNEMISAEEVTFCCSTCGVACNGGKPIEAWNYFKIVAVHTGGDYGSNEGCQPYQVKPCAFDDRESNSCNAQPVEMHHVCLFSCYGEGDYYKNYNTHVKNAYYIMSNLFEKELITYGPLETSFDVYTDFLSYKSGVYSKTRNAIYLGRHSVKIIGWGVDEGVRYWLMVNSWNSTWGDSGTFKIQRDTNECRIEDSATAGVPIVSKFN